MASFVDTVLTAEDTFTDPIDSGSRPNVQIICAGDGAEGFGSTVVTVYVKPKNWPDTQYAPIGTVETADANGQAQKIECGANVQVRAGVASGDFDADVAIYLAKGTT